MYTAQALHAHILVWMKKREQKPDGYKPLAPIPRKAPGTEQRQRPLDQKVDPLEKPQEDNIYHQVHVNRISCEMARPCIGDDPRAICAEVIDPLSCVGHVKARFENAVCSISLFEKRA